MPSSFVPGGSTRSRGVHVLVGLRADPGGLVHVHQARIRAAISSIFLPQELRLPGVPAGEAQPDARVEHRQPLGGRLAGVCQRLVQQVEELLVAGQLVALVGQLLPLAGEGQACSP